MELSESDKIWLHERNMFYSKKMGIEAPTLCFSIADTIDFAGPKQKDRVSHKYDVEHKILGFASYIVDEGDKAIVTVLPDKHIALKGKDEFTRRTEVKVGRKYKHTLIITHRLGHCEETLIHELFHHAHKKHRHGKLFNQKVIALWENDGTLDPFL